MEITRSHSQSTTFAPNWPSKKEKAFLKDLATISFLVSTLSFVEISSHQTDCSRFT